MYLFNFSGRCVTNAHRLAILQSPAFAGLTPQGASACKVIKVILATLPKDPYEMEQEICRQAEGNNGQITWHKQEIAMVPPLDGVASAKVTTALNRIAGRGIPIVELLDLERVEVSWSQHRLHPDHSK